MRERRDFGPWSDNSGTVLFGFAVIFGLPLVLTVIALIKGAL